MTGKVSFIPAKAGDECGAVIEMKWNETIQLHSPNYPNLYPKSIECIWLIKAPNGYSIRFNLTHYTVLSYHPQRLDVKTWRSNFATNVTCQNSQGILEGSVTFYNGNNTNMEILERFCHNLKQPKVVISTTEQSITILELHQIFSTVIIIVKNFLLSMTAPHSSPAFAGMNDTFRS
ncbi:hypothetical protein WUBG_15575 [Wuchereria bancrofti]|uniref:CUB domain-containing protein n=1 Tax=Wuchereria bancrofti TaxID=6293 RepID=J9DV21_WUCBA|nr:hypothetical protein WUBG_15575 [Wuchereria bancrofti]